MPTDTAATLLAELTRHGIKLQARGDRLRYRRRSALTPQLAARVKAHKPELLTLLAKGDRDTTPAARATGTGFRFSDGVMGFGDVCAGWSPAGWAEELRRKASRCDSYRPDIAMHPRDWARDIERRLGRQA